LFQLRFAPDADKCNPLFGLLAASAQGECHVEQSETSLVVAMLELASEMIRDGKPGLAPKAFGAALQLRCAQNDNVGDTIKRRTGLLRDKKLLTELRD
jgi:hypothetical protein